jgi:hypothetical protein
MSHTLDATHVLPDSRSIFKLHGYIYLARPITTRRHILPPAMHTCTSHHRLSQTPTVSKNKLNALSEISALGQVLCFAAGECGG